MLRRLLRRLPLTRRTVELIRVPDKPITTIRTTVQRNQVKASATRVGHDTPWSGSASITMSTLLHHGGLEKLLLARCEDTEECLRAVATARD